VIEWISNRLPGDNDVWGFVVFLLTGHLVGGRRDYEPVPPLVPRPSRRADR
jgi:hypothetical protein